MEVITKGAKGAKGRMKPLFAKHLRVLRALRSQFIGHKQKQQRQELLLQQMAEHFQLTNALNVSYNASSVCANGLPVFPNLRSVYKNLLTFCNYLLSVLAIGGTVLADDSPRIDICPPFISVI